AGVFLAYSAEHELAGIVVAAVGSALGVTTDSPPFVRLFSATPSIIYRSSISRRSLYHAQELPMSRTRRYVCLISILLVLASFTAFAQYGSSLQGTVTDQSGAAVANAKVTAINQATRVSRD